MNKTSNDFVSHFVSQFTKSAPTGLLGAKEELKQWAHTFICDWLAQHELVTRQELMVQQKILQRLENQVKKLELKLVKSESSQKEQKKGDPINETNN